MRSCKAAARVAEEACLISLVRRWIVQAGLWERQHRLDCSGLGGGEPSAENGAAEKQNERASKSADGLHITPCEKNGPRVNR